MKKNLTRTKPGDDAVLEAEKVLGIKIKPRHMRSPRAVDALFSHKKVLQFLLAA
ncbi:MAG: hypothetical protein WCO12_03155 [bacterium]